MNQLNTGWLDNLFTDATQNTMPVWNLNHRLINNVQLDDTIVKRIETSTDQELEESRNLIRRIWRRDIYQVSITKAESPES